MPTCYNLFYQIIYLNDLIAIYIFNIDTSKIIHNPYRKVYLCQMASLFYLLLLLTLLKS